ncbi:hypothetical protein [Candidatus Pelagibacter sp. HIMB1623]|uniref:hypothetical protein n=1 Tax=Candidatus Pelagibacter sp. HIMB1623 TaxID=3413358 RepID=UPI003F8450FD
MKINYIYKNEKFSISIFNELMKIYKGIEKIKKKNEANIAGLLFHELMYFFLNKKINKNSNSVNFKKNEYHQVIKFGKRNNKYIYDLKENSFFSLLLYKLYSTIFSFFKFEKKLFLGQSIPLSTKDKFFLIFFSFIYRYKIVLLNYKDCKIHLSNNTKNFFLKKVSRLLTINKINHKNLNDIKFIINKITCEKELLLKKNNNIIICGSLGIFQNRLLAIKKKIFQSKLCVINHIPTFGFVSYNALKYDDFYLCDYYLTPVGKKINFDDNYIGINEQNYKILGIENKFSKYASNYIKEINFKKLDRKKILYVPARIGGPVLNGKNSIKISDYNKWQDHLANNFGKIDVKYPLKKFYLKKNKKFNILDSKLELIKISKHYDLILIDSISSSTFSELALTNIPILYFNINIDMLTQNGKKIANNRTTEIKVDIFNNYKGFKSLDLLDSKKKTKNTFTSNFFNKDNQFVLYKTLVDVNNKV